MIAGWVDQIRHRIGAKGRSLEPQGLGGGWPVAGLRDGGTVFDGLLAGTLVATETGWRPVETLAAGDRLVTFDRGNQPLVAVARSRLISRPSRLPVAARPLSVPAGALGNRRCMRLLPGQAVMIESDLAERLYGDPFALVPAAALDGWRGIARTPAEPEAEVVHLALARDAVIYAEGMVLIHCPRCAPSPDNIMPPETGRYLRLPPIQGRALIAAMTAS